MPKPASDFWTWVRHHLMISNSRKAWEGRTALLVLVLGVSGMLGLASDLPLSRQILLWAGLLLVLATLLRQGWLQLFGPVFFYDLMRQARRSRYFLMRFLYVAGLSLILVLFYWSFWMERSTGVNPPSVRSQAQFAESFFNTFMWVQFVAIVLLTPAYTAGAIAEEKDRKTLEFLLATDLLNREIVLGKWFARVGNLGLLVLSGIPLLGFTLFLGGVDPELMLAGFVATAFTMLGLASISILASVYSRRTRDAISLSYLIILAYYAISTTLLILASTYPAFGGQGINLLGFSWTIQEFASWLSSGNIFVALFKLQTGGPLTAMLPGLLRDYVLFQCLLSLTAVGWAILRLRAVAIKEQVVKSVRTAGRSLRGTKRREMRNLPPMLWKEVIVDSANRLNAAGKIIVLLLVAISFVPLGIFVYFDLESRFYRGNGWGGFTHAMNYWVAIAGMLVACLTLLGVGIRAAGSVSGERDRQTLDGLLTTPLKSDEMLWAKWLGSLTGLRWGIGWLLLIWGIGVGTFSLHPLMCIALVMTWLVYASVLTLVGLWFSMVSKTTLRATMWTIVVMLGVSIGQWFMTWCCCIPLQLSGLGSSSGLEELYKAVLRLQMSISPPVTLGYMLPWSEEGLFGTSRSYVQDFGPGPMIGFALLGLILWAAAGTLLAILVRARFRELSGRNPRIPAQRSRPRAAAPPG